MKTNVVIVKTKKVYMHCMTSNITHSKILETCLLDLSCHNRCLKIISTFVYQKYLVIS